MKFTPKEIKKNVNVSKISPIRELFVLLTGVCGILLIIYIVLGMAIDVVVDKMPVKLEQTLGNYFSQSLTKQPGSPAEQRIQKLVDELAILSKFPEGSRFTVHVVEDETANAMALPGGHIVILTGLLEDMDTENELTMVLAHELGHFVHKDHLRGLGRSLVLVAISTVLFGTDGNVAEFIINTLITTDLKHSRTQETAADLFALDVLYAKYGHAGGATDFFEDTKEKEDFPAFLKFFSTHPISEERIELLTQETYRRWYGTKEKIPLDPMFKQMKNEEALNKDGDN